MYETNTLFIIWIVSNCISVVQTNKSKFKLAYGNKFEINLIG